LQGLGYLLHNAANLLKREFERTARPYGLTLLQWRVLGALSLDDGQTQTTLASRLEASPMSISDVLERLQGSGLLTREVDPSDSRAKLVSITEEGQRLVTEMRAIAADVYERAAQGIGERDREAMVRALTRMVSNLEEAGVTRKEDA
jgi:DNA-binding MarR family transcriptional regulator